MLVQIARNHKGTLLASVVALALAAGWATREAAHAVEKKQLLASRTLTATDVKTQEFRNEGKPVGTIALYFNGDTAGTRNFVTGRFALEAGKEPHPIHTHPEEEVLIVASGDGEISCDGKTTKVGPGSVMYTAPNAPHGIKNTGDKPLVFYFVKWTGVSR